MLDSWAHAIGAAVSDALDPADLVKLAELIRLSAETARLFSDTCEGGNGKASKITLLAQQIEALAVELRGVAEALSSKQPDAEPN